MLSRKLTRKALNELLSGVKKLLSVGDGFIINGDCIILDYKEETERIGDIIVKDFIIQDAESEHTDFISVDNLPTIISEISNIKRIKNIELVVDEYSIRIIMDEYMFVIAERYDNPTMNEDIRTLGLGKMNFNNIVTATTLCVNENVLPCVSFTSESKENIKKGKLDITSEYGTIRLGKQHFPFLGAIRSKDPLPIDACYKIHSIQQKDNEPEFAIALYVKYKWFESVHVYAVIPFE